MGGGRRARHGVQLKHDSVSFLGIADLWEEGIVHKKSIQSPSQSENKSVVACSKARSDRRRASLKIPEAKPKLSTSADKKQKPCRDDVVRQEVKSKGKVSVPLPHADEIIAAIGSLYEDQLRPFGRILRKRLAERSESCGESAAEVDLVQLRRSCDENTQLSVSREEGGEWSSLITARSDTFIDVYEKMDTYSEEMWQAADLYFQNLPQDDGVLPGGRYACAQTLASRNLDFLQGRTLGKICHFVQLALSTRKVLGYLNGGITSYNRSHSCAKDKAAADQNSCTQPDSVIGLEIATWMVARKCLKLIMKDALSSQVNQVPLSNIKRVFRSHYETELSETSLGHSKLSELLQDERLKDICTVRLLDQGYFVIPTFETTDNQSDGFATDSTSFSWADAEESLLTTDIDELELEAETYCNTPYWPDDESRIQPSLVGPDSLHLTVDSDPLVAQLPSTEWFSLSPRGAQKRLVQNTFIHAPTTPIAVNRPRSQSLPRYVSTGLPSPALSFGLASPLLELMPSTPELWAGIPSSSTPFDNGLDSVPESHVMESEKFSWSQPGDVACSNSYLDSSYFSLDLAKPLFEDNNNETDALLHCVGWLPELALFAGPLDPASVVSLCLADHV